MYHFKDLPIHETQMVRINMTNVCFRCIHGAFDGLPNIRQTLSCERCTVQVSRQYICITYKFLTDLSIPAVQIISRILEFDPEYHPEFTENIIYDAVVWCLLTKSFLPRRSTLASHRMIVRTSSSSHQYTANNCYR